MFAAIGSNGFYVYGCFNLVMLIPVIYDFCPETSRRALESVDLVFQSNSVLNWNMERTYKELLLERGREFSDSEKGRVEMLE